jgi:hypothetical protein
MSPSLERKVREELPELYVDARNNAAASLDAEPDLGRRLPHECPYDWSAVVERDVVAEAGIDLSEGPRRASKAKTRGNA